MATLYWGAVAGNWSDTTKWYTDALLTVPASAKPTAADHVIFVNDSADCILNEAVVMRTITLVDYDNQITAADFGFSLFPLDGDVSDLSNDGGAETQPIYTTGGATLNPFVIDTVNAGSDATVTLKLQQDLLIVKDPEIVIKADNQTVNIFASTQNAAPALHKSELGVGTGGLDFSVNTPLYGAVLNLYGNIELLFNGYLYLNHIGAANRTVTVNIQPPPAGSTLVEGFKFFQVLGSGADVTKTIAVKAGAQLTYSTHSVYGGSMAFKNNLFLACEDGSLVECHSAPLSGHDIDLDGANVDIYDFTLRDFAGGGFFGSYAFNWSSSSGYSQVYIRNRLRFKGTLDDWTGRLPNSSIAPAEGAAYAWVAAKYVEVQGRGTRCSIGGAVSAVVTLTAGASTASIAAETITEPEYAAFADVNTTLKSKSGVAGEGWDCGSTTVTDGAGNTGMVFVGTDYNGCPDWPVRVDSVNYDDPWPPQPVTTFEMDFGGTLPVSKTITITPEAGSLETLLTANIIGVPWWLEYSHSGSGDLQYLTLQPRYDNLAVGVYAAEVVVRVPNGIHSNRLYYVMFTVNPVPEMELATSPLVFITPKSTRPANLVTEVTNKHPGAGGITGVTLVGVPPELDASFVSDVVGDRIGWLHVRPTQASVDQDRGVYLYSFEMQADSPTPTITVPVELVLQATVLGVDDLTSSYISGAPYPTLRLNVDNIGDFTMAQIVASNLGTWLSIDSYGGSGDAQWVDLDVNISTMVGASPPVDQYQQTIDIEAPGAYAPGETQTSDLAPAQIEITILWIEAPLYVATPDEIEFVPNVDWSFPPPQTVAIDLVRGAAVEAVEVITTDPEYPVPSWLAYVLYDDDPTFENQSLLLALSDVPLTDDVSQYASVLKIKTRSDVTDPLAYTATSYLFIPVNIRPPAYLIRENCFLPYVLRIEGELVEDCDILPPPNPVIYCCPTPVIPGPPGASGTSGTSGAPGASGGCCTSGVQ